MWQNLKLYELLKSFTRSVYHSRLTAADQKQRDQRRQFSFSLLIGTLIRLLNRNLWVLPNVIVTLYALRARLNRRFWAFLSRTKIVYSHNTAVKIVVDLARRMLAWWPEEASRIFVLVAADNCHYKLPTDREHVDHDRQQCFYNTVNWFYTFVTREFNERHRANPGGACNV